MHLGNGMVTPACAVFGLGVAAIGGTVGYIMGRNQRRPDAWRFAMGTALVFAAQAFNFTVLPERSSGHMIGGFLLAYWFGSAWGFAAMALTLIVQGVCYGDGGLSALGLNVLNMGVVPCLIVFPLWKKIAGHWEGSRRIASLALGAWVSVVLAALLCGLELLSQSGARAQWSSILLAMVGLHALIGLGEAGITAVAAELVSKVNLRAAAAIVPAVAIAAALGASPWPDGLEFNLSIHGLDLLPTGVSATIDAWQRQSALWSDYSVGPVLMGCLILAMLSGLARAAASRSEMELKS